MYLYFNKTSFTDEDLAFYMLIGALHGLKSLVVESPREFAEYPLSCILEALIYCVIYATGCGMLTCFLPPITRPLILFSILYSFMYSLHKGHLFPK